MKKRRALVIDGQLFQSYAIHRGMGKYSLSLLNELNKIIKLYDKKIIILNNNGIDPEDYKLVKKATSNFKIEKLDLRTSNPQNYKKYRHIEQKNKQILDSYIDKNLKGYEVDFLILSLFQNSECPTFPHKVSTKHILVFDLIPVQFSELYLHEAYTREVYLSRYKVFYEADHFFAISDTVANDLTVHLGIPIDRITPIYGAQISRKNNTPKPYKSLEGMHYILLPTGDDHRKNNKRAIIAFDKANRKIGYTSRLVLTSFFNEKAKKELNQYCKHLVFTGNVPENQLAWLYQNTNFVLFPSQYEGLGMPVLEAVEFNKPVVCSDIGVFREISDNAFNYCDPYSIGSIERAITKTIEGKSHYEEKSYKDILSKYSWKKTAKLMVKALESSSGKSNSDIKKLKIAIFAPTPQGYSAIGKVVQEQHYITSRFAEVDYFLEGGYSDKANKASLRNNLLPYVANCYSPWTFDDKVKSKYDKVFYHIGNSEYHVSGLIKALALPSTVILHDTNIEGLYSVASSLGFIDESRFDAEKQLNKLTRPTKGSFLTSLVKRQDSVYVHSLYAKDAVEAVVPTSKNLIVRQVNLSTPTLFSTLNKQIKKEIVIAFAGLVHEAKGLSLIKDIVSLTILGRIITVRIFGFSLISEKLERELQDIPNVFLIKSLSDLRFSRELRTSDIIINYRPNYHGETSLSTLEALRLGKPVIVNNKGWFKELPQGIVYKIQDQVEILSTLKHIIECEDSVDVKNRIDFIQQEHSVETYVKKILEGNE